MFLKSSLSGRRVLPILLIALLAVLWSCSGANKKPDIVIYGSSECDHCTIFMGQMDSVGYTYVFKDVNNNQPMVDEMMAEVKAYNYKEYINLPVVIVNKEHFFSGPEIGEVVQAINQ
ncbi:MAG: hypothetical protein KDC49_02605 [Saprospiraceae bacterium]|nr:hypothetical protein [Saprospiraceae bacterium]